MNVEPLRHLEKRTTAFLRGPAARGPLLRFLDDPTARSCPFQVPLVSLLANRYSRTKLRSTASNVRKKSFFKLLERRQGLISPRRNIWEKKIHWSRRNNGNALECLQNEIWILHHTFIDLVEGFMCSTIFYRISETSKGAIGMAEEALLEISKEHHRKDRGLLWKVLREVFSLIAHF